MSNGSKPSKLKKSYIFLFFLVVIKSIVKNIYYKIVCFNSNKSRNRFYYDFIHFCRTEFKNNQSTKNIQNIILCDVFTVPDYIFVNQFAIAKLKKYYNADAISYGSYVRQKQENILYNSIGITKHFNINLFSIKLNYELYKLFLQAQKDIKTKRDLLDYKINDIGIGRDIYESILRTGIPTVDINADLSWQYIYIGLKYYVYFNNLFKIKNVKAFVLSHDMYIHMGIPSKIGYKYNIPTYLFSDHEFIKLEYQYQLDDRFKEFPIIFNKIVTNEFERESALKWSKETLEKRLSGQVGVEMFYQQLSAFTQDKIVKQILNNDNLNVVIATHEFYDNPHAFGGLIFDDFYEWLTYIGELSKITKYNFYLKPHRDAVENEILILKYFEKKYNNFILLNPNYTFHQLKEEGVKHVLTCYGSVGHELPLLDMIVINAGNNPHIGYNFNFHPKTKKEYKELLLNLIDLKITINKNEIFEFFYVYKKIFNNMKLSIYDFGEHKSDNVYENFLNIRNDYEKIISLKLDKFINQQINYFFQTK